MVLFLIWVASCLQSIGLLPFVLCLAVLCPCVYTMYSVSSSVAML